MGLALLLDGVWVTWLKQQVVLKGMCPAIPWSRGGGGGPHLLDGGEPFGEVDQLGKRALHLVEEILGRTLLQFLEVLRRLL